MKKLNFCLIVFLILAMAVMFSACAQIGTDPDRIPKSKTVTVTYDRVLPVPNPEGADAASLDWVFGSFEGGNADMSKVAENS
ncbi:MAG: hypothetical protein Q8O30_09525, partial [Candidatus Omnitrophota bacterium]|nr:hypothetical protein [Candidatus Omnitrophota bacterium]